MQDLTPKNTVVDTRVNAAYLDDVNRIDVVRQAKLESFARLDLQAGQSVLDAGCATGDDVRELARIVGAYGRAVGLDHNPEMVEEARKRGLARGMEIVEGSVTELPFSDGTFHAYRAERVFQLLTEPQRAAAEMYRVLKSGGRAALMDSDWETVMIAGGERMLTRRIVTSFSDNLGNGWAGRNHRGLFARSGFKDIDTQARVISLPFDVALPTLIQLMVESAVKTCVTTTEQSARWLADLKTATERNEFYLGFSAFMTAGTRP